MLRQFAIYLDADLTENFGAAQLVLDNEKGAGTIKLYDVFPGLTAWVYNVSFNSEVSIDMTFGGNRPFYFGYHVSGHQFQKFDGEKDYETIKQGQNFILASEPGSSTMFIIPSQVKYECCYLIINPTFIKDSEIRVRQQLSDNLSELMSPINAITPYRYFGNIDLRIGRYAEIIIKNERTDLVGRLLTEGAIANMLAAQIEVHDLDKETVNFEPVLSTSELTKILNLGDYIRDHISGDLSMNALSYHFGISQKKLQTGARFLYDSSVGEYITSIRLEVAKELIHDSELSISEICFLIGLSSRSYFSKIFKNRFGIGPNDYKKSFYRDGLFYEVSYRSIAMENINEEDIATIISKARILNKKNGVTGSLIFHNNFFFQLIEGPKKNILRLYENIKRDTRHSDVKTIWNGPKPKRDFDHWSLAFLSDDGLLNIEKQGDIKSLNLDDLLDDDSNKIMLNSQAIWRKVRLKINAANG